MKLIGPQFNYAGVHLIVAAALVATLAFAPGAVFAADKDAHVDRAEMRIKDMHTQLMITPAEEAQWDKIADLMRDNAKTMDTLTQARIEHAKDMTAVDDLKSYGEIAQAHADGIKNLTPLFADLYAGMSDEQKKVADTLFRHGKQKHADHKHGHKKHEGK